MAKPNLREEIARVLRVAPQNLDARLRAMKLGPVCSRCYGSGRYSFNQVDGDRCYGCHGHGHMKPRAKDLPAVLDAAKVAAEDGRLDRYIDGLRAGRIAKQGSKRIFAAWRASRVARALAGWSSHNYGHGVDPRWQVPGNFDEVCAANAKMAAASKAGHDAIDAWQYAKAGPGIDRQALALAAEAAIEAAIAAIAEADIEPSPELIAFVQGKQRAAADRVKERGFNPGFEIYGA